MAWTMTSKRFPGFVGSPPRVEFMLGALPIAAIVMLKPEPTWRFGLYTAGGEFISEFPSFSLALKHLHELLNSPSPEGFEVFQSQTKDKI